MNFEMPTEDWSDAHIEAAIMGHLDAESLSRLQKALEINPALSRRMEQLRSEKQTLLWILNSNRDTEHPTGDVEDEVLAQYLDNTLDAQAREELELKLSGSPALLARLIQLNRELTLILDPERPILCSERHFEGEQVDLQSESDARQISQTQSILQESNCDSAGESTDGLPRTAENR